MSKTIIPRLRRLRTMNETKARRETGLRRPNGSRITWWSACAFLTICCFAAKNATATHININNALTQAYVSDLGVFNYNESYATTSGVITATDGAYSSNLSTTYDTDSKIRSDYTLQFPHTASGIAVTAGYTKVEFTPSTDLNYIIFGSNATVSTWDENTANAENVWMLTDLTSNNVIFKRSEGWQDNAHFLSEDGDFMGILMAGNDYRWESSSIGSNNNLSGGPPINLTASATLAFTPVPEPGTMSLVSLGAFGLVAWGVRRRRK